MCVKIRKSVMINGDYHNIERLLTLEIIVSNENSTILIIVKENIMFNFQMAQVMQWPPDICNYTRKVRLKYQPFFNY